MVFTIRPPLATATKITAAVLVLHGWEDPLAPREQTVALADELTQYGADWQIHMFGHNRSCVYQSSGSG